MLIARSLDHAPHYRQGSIFARSGLARSTLAQWAGTRGARLQPRVDAMEGRLLIPPVLQAHGLQRRPQKPCRGRTHRTHLWSE